MSKKPTVIIGELALNGNIAVLYEDFKKSGTYLYGPSLITDIVRTGRVKITIQKEKITIEKI